MMLDNVQFTQQTLSDQMQMGKFMKEANNKYKDAMDNFDIDEF